MKSILCAFILFALLGCGRQRHSQSGTANSTDTVSFTAHTAANSIYYWKTVYNPSKSELAFLKQHDVKRMYVRFFDVAVDNYYLGNESMVIPLATTVFKQSLPAEIEIVPTVYITLEALRSMKGQEREFAGKMITRILAMAECHQMPRIAEIQFDCDWTKTTQESYFRMCGFACDTLHSRGLALSTTIRLHQLKDPCPPVDRGVLMLYNTGALKNADTENSILKYEDVRSYLQNRTYALPLDFAYPTFAWGIWFRDGQFKAILRSTDYSDKALYTPSEKGMYQVAKDHLLESHQLQKGDLIRLENSAFQEIRQVKQLAEKSLGQASVIVYHLDSANLSKYTTDEIKTIYSRR